MMRRAITSLSFFALFATVRSGISPEPARAAEAVSSSGDRPIDTTINLLLRSNDVATEFTTAVVPIIGVPNKAAALRFAQISGPQNAVGRVQAVIEIDNPANNGPWQFTALIPVSSVVNNGRGHRVEGVGVTAIITK